mgnify:CR=1 FL=1
MKIPVWLKFPANRTVTEVALALALLHLAGLLWAVVWLAELVAYQREIIRYLAPWLR